MPKAEGSGHAHDHGEGHGDMRVQVEDTHHEDGHAHSHEDTANGEHPNVTETDRKTPASDGAGNEPRKTGHTHAPGTQPHKD